MTAARSLAPHPTKVARIIPEAGRMQLEDLLLRHGAISEEQLQRARADQKVLGGDLGHILVDLGFLSEDLLCRARSHQLKLPRVSPDAIAIPEELLQAVPVQVCEKLGVIAVGRDKRSGALQVATHDPGSATHLKAIADAVGAPVVPVVATPESIDRAIRRHYYGEPLKEREAPQASADPFAEVPQQSTTNPQLAALLARIEQLEQKAARIDQIVQVLRTVGDVLVESGLITREEYLRRARGG